MSTLHEIVSQSLDLTNALIEAGGEITPEIEEWLKTNEVVLASKVDACVLISERMEAEEAYWKAKADEFKAIADGMKKARERIKDNVKGAMRALNITEIQGADYVYKLSKRQPKLVIEDAAKLPEDFVVTTVVKEPAKEKMIAALKDGFEVPGARLEDVVALLPGKNKKVK